MDIRNLSSIENDFREQLGEYHNIIEYNTSTDGLTSTARFNEVSNGRTFKVAIVLYHQTNSADIRVSTEVSGILQDYIGKINEINKKYTGVNCSYGIHSMVMSGRYNGGEAYNFNNFFKQLATFLEIAKAEFASMK